MARIGVGTVTITDIFDGGRGPGHFYVDNTAAAETSWLAANDALAASACTDGIAIVDDIVTMTFVNNTVTPFATSKICILGGSDATSNWENFAEVIDGNLLVNGTVNALAIVSGSIDTLQLKAESITAAKIKVNTITASQIAVNTITAAEIDVVDLFAVDATIGGVLTIKGSTYDIIMQGGDNISPFYIIKKSTQEQVFGIDSTGEMWFEGGIGVGSIRSISAFTQNVYDQLVPTVTNQTGGADIMASDLAVVSGVSTTLSIPDCNTTDITVALNFKDSDSYLGPVSGLPGWTKSTWTIKIERQIGSGTFSILLNQNYTGTHYVYEETSNSEEGYSTNINITFEDIGHGSTTSLTYRFTATYVSGSTNAPKFKSGSIGQAIQGGAALNVATSSQLGGVKIGSGISVDSNGVISTSMTVSTAAPPVASGSLGDVWYRY